jgi:hypothetical protein
MQFSTYNGWENKFTWLVHLHLSNEFELANEMAELVAQEPNDVPAGRLVEMWVKVAVENWITFFPGRNRQYDEYVRLFVWDLLRSALAYADWDALVGMLTSEVETSDNLFTWTLYRNIMDDSQLQQNVSALISEAPSIYAGVDTVKDWFESQLDTWMTVPAARQHKNSAMSILAYSLIQNTYGVIYWEHVARAFRGDY